MKNILVVEDDYMLNSGLCYNLELDGYTAVGAINIEEAKKQITHQVFDLLLLDVNLPDGSGFDFCKFVRKSNNVPVIFLTANDLEEEIIKGYELGADDYVSKPFQIKVLLKKITAILNRHATAGTQNIYRTGNLLIDFDEMQVKVMGDSIPFTPTEYKLLRIFTENPNMVITRQLFLEKLWDVDENYVDEHALTVNINRLRKKLEKAGEEYIKTIYGMGYCWVEESK